MIKVALAAQPTAELQPGRWCGGTLAGGEADTATPVLKALPGTAQAEAEGTSDAVGLLASNRLGMHF